ncbi:MAG: rhomboid family intramembrane serine protease [Promethearchaeota archaeon]|jgi:rhomboid protease GluP
MELEPKKIPFHKQYISIIIVVINVIIFFILQTIPNQSRFIVENALIPGEIIKGNKFWTIFTAMFIHINYVHLITNMFVFYLVANKLEKETGHFLFLIIYLLSGICGFLLHIMINLFDTAMIDIMMYGASGAIFGILGFYLILFFNRIYQNINLSHLFSYIVIHLIFLTAVMVHFGGFVTGILMAFLFKAIKGVSPKNDSKEFVNWSKLGHAYLSNRMFKHAIPNLEIAIRLNSSNITALIDLGTCYQELNNLSEAINIYEQVLRIDSHNNIALYNLARIYFEMEQYKKALRMCNEALQINSNFKDAIDLQDKIILNSS